MREAQKKKTSPNTLKPMKVQQQKQQLKKVSTNETSKSQSLTESKSNDISKTSASKEKMVKSLQKMPRTRKDLGFARNLGSTVKRVRNKSIAVLIKYFQKKKTLPELTYLKIWHGLFFCLWMTDKTEIQNELALKLARISEKLTFEESIKYFHAFWSIMSLHWELIDRLRMDKFYRLMRCVIKQSFQTLDKEGWDEEKVKIYTTMLKETALNPQNSKGGIITHIGDLYIEEARKFEISESIATLLIEPFVFCLSRNDSKMIFIRIHDSIFLNLSHETVSYYLKKDEKKKGIKEYRFRPNFSELSKICFNYASDKDSLDNYRKRLYRLSNKFDNLSRAKTLLSKEQKRNQQKRKLKEMRKAQNQEAIENEENENENIENENETEENGNETENIEQIEDVIEDIEMNETKKSGRSEPEQIIEEEIKEIAPKKKKRKIIDEPETPSKFQPETPIQSPIQVQNQALTEPVKKVRGILKPMSHSSEKKKVRISIENNTVKKFHKERPSSSLTTPKMRPKASDFF